MSIDSLLVDQPNEGCFKGGNWIECYPSGNHLSYSNPQPDQIDIQDIAHALSLENRFGGHSKFAWSVAAHSVVVYSEVAKRVPFGRRVVCLAALLHDAHEAYVKDVMRPLKLIIGPAYKDIARRIQDVIHVAFWIGQTGHRSVSESEWRLIRQIDNQCLRAEAKIVTVSGGRDWNWGDTEPAPWIEKMVREVSPSVARKWFLKSAGELGLDVRA